MGDQEAMRSWRVPGAGRELARTEAPGRYEGFESQARHVGNCPNAADR
jgi:hypothetical protein